MKQPKEKAYTIPMHKLIDRTQAGIEVRYINRRKAGSGDRLITPHRDDHFLFVFQESGKSKLFIDFEAITLHGCALICILPGQVHYNISMEKVWGWLVSLSPHLVSPGSQTIFEEQIQANLPILLSSRVAAGIKACLRLLYEQLSYSPSGVNNSVVPPLAGAFAEMTAVQYADIQSRNYIQRPQAARITSRFKALLIQQFRTLKAPAQYAKALNYSLSHLNESVKSTTGQPVSHWIQHQVLLEARRLLYYSELNVSEIAETLGYEDQAYFTRLFTKKAGVPPLAFRKKFRG